MEKGDVIKAVKEATVSSELVAAVVASGKKPKARKLNKDEIVQLEKNGNVSSDWKRVMVTEGFNPERVRNSTFSGEVILARFDGSVEIEDGLSVPTGIYNSYLVDTWVGNNVLVRDLKFLANYVVEEGAVLINNGIVSTSKDVTFGNGIELPIAIETGGREVLTYGDITIDVASTIATCRQNGKLLIEYRKLIDEYVKKVTSSRGTVGKGAMVKNTNKVLDTYVGPFSKIDNARSVINSTILSDEEEPTEVSEGAYLKDSVIQWGSEVTTMAIVDSSVLTEHSHVERHGKVTQSILGPNTGVAEGEVTASLLGPFVGFHHQALLIAAYWPEGKGNVGYGANVGSNHTSKAPDQEIWCGEGTFFGLGVNVKYPADFSKAPYSIVATAVNTLPQKVTFPFSLINTPAASYPGISPAFNEITPGWVLSDNIFTLKRNEGKYKKRNKARRSKFVFDVFRPDTVDLMIDARKRLEVSKPKDIYTSKDIEGLGKNYMLEESRKKAIEAYTFYIQYYALLGLKRKLEEVSASGKNPGDLLSAVSDDLVWEHQRGVINRELKGKTVAENLKLLASMQEEIAKDVQISKEKDDKRGAKTIEDYPLAHPPAKEDSFVIETWEATNKMKGEIDAFLKKL